MICGKDNTNFVKPMRVRRARPALPLLAALKQSWYNHLKGATDVKPRRRLFREPEKSQTSDGLKQLRAFLKEQLPNAEETLTYKMPTYIHSGHPVVAVASQKHYMSLYMDTELVEKHRGELGGLDCGKGCIRFKTLDSLPLDVISTILQETIEKQNQ
jgi:uncharacterized protein YdhG (YjbR/CyaY superfamily)